ncbi:MAG: 8-amino-7-oxononanoate synthase [Planctomycetota bacterium]|nr:8-amino-7-oxononanoate synthase [Planctomycetota bacterium]
MSENGSSPLDWIEAELSDLAQHGLRRSLRTRVGPQGATITLDGHPLINFGSNDYLGLAGDARLAAAACDAVNSDGWGSGASPLICGRSAVHARLEKAIVEFEGCQAALLFPSGFAANAGTLAALVGREDIVFSDASNHASLIDGCRLSRAEIRVYRHGDYEHLRSLLEQGGSARRRLIVTDSVFSMDGDFAPLDQLAALRDEFHCMLMVDEAHATGVFGESGRGVAQHFGVEPHVDVKVGTLSKALGCAGGFVCGSQALVDWLLNRARPYVYSTAQPPAGAAAACAALRIVQSEPQRRVELLQRAAHLRTQLAAQGWRLGKSASQIIPIYVDDAHRVMELSARLADQGFFVPGIRPPTVPPGQSLLRVSLCHGHDDSILSRFLQVMNGLRG